MLGYFRVKVKKTYADEAECSALETIAAFQMTTEAKTLFSLFGALGRCRGSQRAGHGHTGDGEEERQGKLHDDQNGENN